MLRRDLIRPIDPRVRPEPKATFTNQPPTKAKIPPWLIPAVGIGITILLVTGLLTSWRPTPSPSIAAASEAQKIVDEQVERLFEDAPVPADRVVQDKRVDDYRKVKDFATRNGAIMPTGCTIARRAYNVGEFLLAKEAWDDCYLDGQVNTNNRAELAFYAPILRNLGRHWAENGDDEQTRYKGLAYLVACAKVVERYRLNVGECQQDLVWLIGSEGWPSPAITPLLISDSSRKEK